MTFRSKITAVICNSKQQDCRSKAPVVANRGCTDYNASLYYKKVRQIKQQTAIFFNVLALTVGGLQMSWGKHEMNSQGIAEIKRVPLQTWRCTQCDCDPPSGLWAGLCVRLSLAGRRKTHELSKMRGNCSLLTLNAASWFQEKKVTLIVFII